MPVLEQAPDALRQFCHGDLDAFEALFRRHQSDVYGWIVRIVRDPAAAEDLTVETFWRIYRAHARFDAKRHFAPWARRIATNAALDHLKTARPETDLPNDLPSRCRRIPASPRSFAGRRHTLSAGFRLSCRLRPRWR
jgi:RNA polymerase sigma factor (sigma-70 family)